MKNYMETSYASSDVKEGYIRSSYDTGTKLLVLRYPLSASDRETPILELESIYNYGKSGVELSLTDDFRLLLEVSGDTALVIPKSDVVNMRVILDILQDPSCINRNKRMYSDEPLHDEFGHADWSL